MAQVLQFCVATASTVQTQVLEPVWSCPSFGSTSVGAHEPELEDDITDPWLLESQLLGRGEARNQTHGSAHASKPCGVSCLKLFCWFIPGSTTLTQVIRRFLSILTLGPAGAAAELAAAEHAASAAELAAAEPERSSATGLGVWLTREQTAELVRQELGKVYSESHLEFLMGKYQGSEVKLYRSALAKFRPGLLPETVDLYYDVWSLEIQEQLELEDVRGSRSSYSEARSVSRKRSRSDSETRSVAQQLPQKELVGPRIVPPPPKAKPRVVPPPPRAD